jgi:hypothetical protein
MCLLVLFIAGNIFRPVSAISQDTTACLAITAPQITGPADGAILFRDPATGEIHEKLAWTSISGVSLYYFQIFSSPSGMEVSTGNAATNEAAISLAVGTYTWHVTRVDQTDGCPLLGEWSETFAFTIKDNDVIPPVNFQATDGTYPDRVVLTWDLNLQGGSYLPDWFSIYRRPVVADEFLEIAHQLPAGARSFTDTSALTNEVYAYWVVAGSDAHGEQASQPDGGYASQCIPVGTPVQEEPVNAATLYIDPDAGIISYYSWTRPTGVYNYQVQTVNATTGELLFDETAAGVSYRIPDVEIGEYRWRVRALSPVANCATGAWTGYWTYTVNPIYTYPVTNLNASDGAFSDRVQLTWQVDASGQGNGFIEPTSFVIYRAESLDGPKTELAHLRINPPLRYEDTSAQPGKKYFYWVKSDDYFQYPSWSLPDEGWARAALVLENVIFLPNVRR